MCHFDELYSGPEGYIVYCRNCRSYQVGFGCTVLTLSSADLNTVYLRSGKLLDELNDYADEEVKQAILHTPYEGVHLLLSVKELRQFHAILDGVSGEVTALAMLALFYAS